MLFHPMTFIVILVLGMLLIAGLLLIRRAGRSEQPQRLNRVCQRCQTQNNGRAKYCSNCGLPLT